MVDLYIGDLTSTDVIMAVATGLIVSVILTAAYYLATSGRPKWKARKLVHVSIGTVVGLTLVGYSNLSGPGLAMCIFVFILFYAWAHKSELVWELLLAGSRDGETQTNTFMAGLMGMISFGAVFMIFYSTPAIFVTAILAVAWGDAAGEAIGRPFGGKILKRKYRNKSLEGTIGVFGFTMLSIIVSLFTYSSSTCIPCFFLQIVIVAACATVAELLSIGWTDNFFIPVVTAIAMWLFVFPGIILFPL
jgi:dolichol kinase